MRTKLSALLLTKHRIPRRFLTKHLIPTRIPSLAKSHVGNSLMSSSPPYPLSSSATHCISFLTGPLAVYQAYRL